MVALSEVGVTCGRDRNVTMATLFLCFVLLFGDKHRMSRFLLNYKLWSYRCARVVCAQRFSCHTQPLNLGFTRVKFDLTSTRFYLL